MEVWIECCTHRFSEQDTRYRDQMAVNPNCFMPYCRMLFNASCSGCYSSGIPCFNSPSFAIPHNKNELSLSISYCFTMVLWKKPKHHHHVSVIGLGRLLTRSGLRYPEVSSEVCHDSFCHLGKHYSPTGRRNYGRP